MGDVYFHVGESASGENDLSISVSVDGNNDTVNAFNDAITVGDAVTPAILGLLLPLGPEADNILAGDVWYTVDQHSGEGFFFDEGDEVSLTVSVYGDNNTVNATTNAGAGTATWGDNVNLLGSSNTVADTASAAGSAIVGNSNTVDAQNAIAISSESILVFMSVASIHSTESNSPLPLSTYPQTAIPVRDGSHFVM